MESWGLTPVNAIAGATLRYTHDHRFLVRQHVDPALRGVITAGQTASAARQHLALFHAAYPQLQDVPLERTWSGTISVTRNGAPVWGVLRRRSGPPGAVTAPAYPNRLSPGRCLPIWRWAGQPADRRDAVARPGERYAAFAIPRYRGGGRIMERALCGAQRDARVVAV
jgi:hypothetical protein